MTDWYQAIVDTHADKQGSAELAMQVASVLMRSGLIDPLDDVVDFTRKSVSSFAPGPRFAEFFDHKTGTENLEIHADGWVSDYGIVGLEMAACPVCGTEISIQNVQELELIKAELVRASHQFLKTGDDVLLPCPICTGENLIKYWQTEPHLGFCQLAFVFWNWPPVQECRYDLVRFLGETLKHNIVFTYGRL